MMFSVCLYLMKEKLQIYLKVLYSMNCCTEYPVEVGTEESGEFEPRAAYDDTESQDFEDAPLEDSFEYFSSAEQVCTVSLQVQSIIR